MTQINKLSALDAFEAGDLLLVFDTSNGDARKASLSLLKTWLEANLTTKADKTTQKSSPTATGATTNVTDGSASIWLILTPSAAFAAHTIKLPALANCVEGQEVLVNCTKAITTLTVNGNGANVVGAPTTLAANDFFRLRFDSANGIWYRVG